MTLAYNVNVFGSTGSIGEQSLEAAEAAGFNIYAISFGEQVEKGVEQIEKYRPARVHLKSHDHLRKLAEIVENKHIDCSQMLFTVGDEELDELLEDQVERSVIGVSGFSAITLIDACIEAGQDMVLANKEAVVSAGEYLLNKARQKGVVIFPADSEHSAIWQCLRGEKSENVKRIWLSASGGPFYGRNEDELKNVKPEEAANHPKWKMGKKISIDSATMMNKALELIEACRLFNVSEEQVEVVVHPEAVIHSMVEFNDGSFKAQLAAPDMRIPLLLGMSWPDRLKIFEFEKPLFAGVADLKAADGFYSLNFAAPGSFAAKALNLAREAEKIGMTAPCVLNAANEAAVRLFVDQKIFFTQIAKAVELCLQYFSKENLFEEIKSLDEVYAAHEKALQYVNDCVCDQLSK